MITEDYVSYEIAKLLKNKGFDEATNRYYNAQCNQIRTVSDTFMWHWNNEEFMKRVLMEGAIAIPTLQMAMKWLREVHSLYLDIVTSFSQDGICYTFSCSNTMDLIQGTKGTSYHEYQTYEQACEAAIKYCLEKLI